MVIVCREIKVPGSGRSTVARLKLEGIDGKSPSGAEPAACERPVVVCVGGEEGERVSASIASPCVRSKRPRVYRHHAHMSYHMCAWCRYTRGRFERTHGGVLNVHTGVFHIFQRAATHKHTPHTPDTHHDHQRHHDHITQHGDRNRERQRKRDKKREDETRRQEKRREEKR